ncbi:MAG: hypothetical protein JSR77_08945 [Planctomycetes bacterium]|nr:hypothetical protein [Planctomycetota bacterium]
MSAAAKRRERRHAAASLLAFGACGVAAVIAACSNVSPKSSDTPRAIKGVIAGEVAFSPEEVAAMYSMSPLPPVPPDPTNRVADNAAAARLGQYLFFDKRLSAKGTVSCATCHSPETGWADGQRIPEKFAPTMRHVPTLWNVAYNRWYFWDGRADTLWAQALDPIEMPNEHGATREQCAEVIRNDPALRAAYQRVFGPVPQLPDRTDGTLSPEERRAVDQLFVNIGKSLAAFERRIVSGHAPFDTFVEGVREGNLAKIAAISPGAQRGLKLFLGAGNCRSCHHGPNFTDGEFHDTGVSTLGPAIPDGGRFDGINRLLTSPFNSMGEYNDDPEGRRTRPTAYLTNQVEFRGQFKTPTLRNVASTGPYMHRGQLATLREVIEFYANPPSPQSSPPPPGFVPHRHAAGGTVTPERILQPLPLSPLDINDLVSFLETLTDTRIDPSLTRQPATP